MLVEFPQILLAAQFVFAKSLQLIVSGRNFVCTEKTMVCGGTSDEVRLSASLRGPVLYSDGEHHQTTLNEE
jgi:hypothetical protein